MSATTARQAGRVQLEQSDMRLALNIAEMPKGGFSHTAIEETEQLIKQALTEFREEMQRGVEFPGHNKVKAAMERHPAMVRENPTASCLRCHNGTRIGIYTYSASQCSIVAKDCMGNDVFMPDLFTHDSPFTG
jgi:hypothetical protein